jgi:hypothetical protein
MILPALSAGLTSNNPAVTLGSPLVSPGLARLGQSGLPHGWVVGQFGRGSRNA